MQSSQPSQKNVPYYRTEKVSKLELELQEVEELKKELEHLEKTTVELPEQSQGGDKPLDFESFKQLYLNMKKKGSLKARIRYKIRKIEEHPEYANEFEMKRRKNQ